MAEKGKEERNKLIKPYIFFFLLNLGGFLKWLKVIV
tara:strand:+ start:562 stop:669 length:108 start_codon:yes stop_codon:yes gene_type:complete